MKLLDRPRVRSVAILSNRSLHRVYQSVATRRLTNLSKTAKLPRCKLQYVVLLDIMRCADTSRRSVLNMFS